MTKPASNLPTVSALSSGSYVWKTDAASTGLGLTISRDIAHTHRELCASRTPHDLHRSGEGGTRNETRLAVTDVFQAVDVLRSAL